MGPRASGLVLLVLLGAAPAWAASTTMTCASASGTNWTGPTNILANDGTNYASYNTTTRDVLSVTDCSPDIPAGSTVTGIQARVLGCGTGGTSTSRRFDINLLNLGTCTEKTDNNQVACGSWTDQTIPSGTADTWGCDAISDTAVNASAFGVAIRDTNTTATELREQYVEIILTYSTITTTTTTTSTTTTTTVAAARNRLLN